MIVVSVYARKIIWTNAAISICVLIPIGYREAGRPQPERLQVLDLISVQEVRECALLSVGRLCLRGSSGSQRAIDNKVATCGPRAD